MTKKTNYLLSSYGSGLLEAGVDEVGRGCLAGPVVASAVILPSDFKHPLLNDSKKISAKNRELLKVVIEKEAIAFAVAEISHTRIDEINILNASFEAMHKAIKNLKQTPELLLVDGNRFTAFPNINHHCIIKGDGKYASIAAASILAKVYRDDLMCRLSEKFPLYQWQNNMGYPTKAHREAIQEIGICKWHRKSFKH